MSLLDLEPATPWLPTAVSAVTAAGLVLLARCGARGLGGRTIWVARAGVLVAAALLVLGPHVGARTATYVEQLDRQVILAVDRTASMSAVDQTSRSRLDVAVRDIRDIVGQADGTFALVTWGRRPQLTVPFTDDTDAVARRAGLIEAEAPAAGVGSSTNRPLSTLARLVELAGQEHPERATYLIVMSDGEDTATGPRRSYAPLADGLAGGLVIGYGSGAGAVVPLEPTNSGQAGADDVVTDPRTGRAVLSRRDEENLRRVASELGVTYRPREAAGLDAAVMTALEPETKIRQTTISQSISWLIALLLLGCLLPDLRRLALSAREIRDLERPA
ncbi:VWA domain-containing protein [Nocardioides sp.]|uniref:VWA domain-containing protein n=1 Tax=Nocardioides sp. TaxID=35761 RepID=UPI0025F2B958|nr:VWA domain-containing protein [Nocardioides sp.]